MTRIRKSPNRYWSKEDKLKIIKEVLNGKSSYEVDIKKYYLSTNIDLKNHSINVIKLLKYKIKEVSKKLADSLTSTHSDLNNLNLNFQLRFDD